MDGDFFDFKNRAASQIEEARQHLWEVYMAIFTDDGDDTWDPETVREIDAHLKEARANIRYLRQMLPKEVEE